VSCSSASLVPYLLTSLSFSLSITQISNNIPQSTTPPLPQKQKRRIQKEKTFKQTKQTPPTQAQSNRALSEGKKPEDFVFECGASRLWPRESNPRPVINHANGKCSALPLGHRTPPGDEARYGHEGKNKLRVYKGFECEKRGLCAPRAFGSWRFPWHYFLLFSF
jgi:hypothetical protein